VHLLQRSGARSCSCTYTLYEDVKKMGMAIKELKIMRHSVAEIAAANDISEHKATEKFFSDVQSTVWALNRNFKIRN
jgi:hypothetical protein